MDCFGPDLCEDNLPLLFNSYSAA
ncbi:hypothetical protein AGR7A_Cc120255 [Agrobacterium deltaense NCPPB 1641]|uniref:Uncharacterized protein n=1 Tax=Agrobacterium deltaense NCPPB 1641 TaxID=1183425 RepID=A0A1S7TJL7_9HYPH|nr:hypothetical protein AGR7A_Cc120255 [Agrobacterium deltaense NCPPB 1641]